MAVLTVQSINKAGIDQLASLVAADAAGDQVPTSTGLLMMVSNADASSHTVTITAPVPSANCGSYGTLPVEDIVHAVAAGEQVSFTIPSGYADQGSYTWAYDDVTSVTVGVFSLS